MIIFRAVHKICYAALLITEPWSRESIGNLAKAIIQCTEYCLLNVHVQTGLGILQPMHYLVLSTISLFRPDPLLHHNILHSTSAHRWLIFYAQYTLTHQRPSMLEQRYHVPNVHHTMHLEFWLFVLIAISPHSYQYMRHKVKRVDARKWLRCPIRRNDIICGKIPSYTRLLGKFKVLSKQQQHDACEYVRYWPHTSWISFETESLSHRTRNLLQVMVDRVGIQSVDIYLVHHHKFNTLSLCKTFDRGTFLWSVDSR